MECIVVVAARGRGVLSVAMRSETKPKGKQNDISTNELL